MVMTAFCLLSVRLFNKVSNTSMNLFLKMAQFTKVTSAKVSDTAPVFKYGLMAPSTKASGVITKPMERVSSGTQMETSMKVNGKTTRPMVMVSTFMSMALDTKVTGRMICRMVPVLKAGLMAHVTTAAIGKA